MAVMAAMSTVVLAFVQPQRGRYTMFHRRVGIASVVMGVLAPIGSAHAQNSSQPIVGISTVTTYSTDAKISAVDANARTVTFAFGNGATATRKVSPALASFNTARVGDTVSVSFEDRLTFVLAGPNAKVPAS